MRFFSVGRLWFQAKVKCFSALPSSFLQVYFALFLSACLSLSVRHEHPPPPTHPPHSLEVKAITIPQPISPSSPGNPLLLNSSMQPELTAGQTYSGPICFQDSIDKELFDPLPDMMVKVQSSFMVSLGVADRAEYHVKAQPDGYGGTQGRKATLLAPNGPLGPCKAQLRSSGVFGHLGGRLVMPNSGKWLH